MIALDGSEYLCSNDPAFVVLFVVVIAACGVQSLDQDISSRDEIDMF